MTTNNKCCVLPIVFCDIENVQFEVGHELARYWHVPSSVAFDLLRALTHSIVLTPGACRVKRPLQGLMWGAYLQRGRFGSEACR